MKIIRYTLLELILFTMLLSNCILVWVCWGQSWRKVKTIFLPIKFEEQTVNVAGSSDGTWAALVSDVNQILLIDVKTSEVNRLPSEEKHLHGLEIRFFNNSRSHLEIRANSESGELFLNCFDPSTGRRNVGCHNTPWSDHEICKPFDFGANSFLGTGQVLINRYFDTIINCYSYTGERLSVIKDKEVWILDPSQLKRLTEPKPLAVLHPEGVPRATRYDYSGNLMWIACNDRLEIWNRVYFEAWYGNFLHVEVLTCLLTGSCLIAILIKRRSIKNISRSIKQL